MTQKIDGKAFAEGLRERIGKQVADLKVKTSKTPGLAVVLVGEDPASQIYVSNKAKQTKQVGMESFEHILPVDTSEAELLQLIDKLNKDDAVHGILVQLPLPKHISEDSVIQSITPEKDVDGFHVVNRGLLVTGQKSLVPCTPQGSLMLIKDVLGEDISGLNAVVIGRSNIVGKPMSQLLLNEGCTVTTCHSKTKDIKFITQTADILVVAVGRSKMVDASWVKEGAVIIDVGINRVENPEEGAPKIVGDVDYESCFNKVRAITPVPGGAGPMTIACLLNNTLQAFRMIEKL